MRFEDFDARGFIVNGFVVEIGNDVGVVHSNPPPCSGHGDNHHHNHPYNFFFLKSSHIIITSTPTLLLAARSSRLSSQSFPFCHYYCNWHQFSITIFIIFPTRIRNVHIVIIVFFIITIITIIIIIMAFSSSLSSSKCQNIKMTSNILLSNRIV